MNYTSQKDYAENICIIGEIYASIPERLMYVIYDKKENKHFFCFHLLDSDNSTVEYVVPISLDELQTLIKKKTSIHHFLYLAFSEKRLFKHVFRLKNLNGKPDYEINLEKNLFNHVLPNTSVKFKRIEFI